MFDELLNGSSKVVSKSSAVSSADAPNQRQQHTTPLNNHTTPTPTCQVPTLAPTITSSENMNQAETYAENDQIKDHPLERVIGNPSQSVRTRRQLELDGEMCMFALTVSQTKPKNIKEAMADSAWIDSMQEELHQDGENLDKIKEKGDACMYSTQSRAYRVFNKRTRVIVETIHVNFDELPHMASDHVSSDPTPECQRMALEHDSLNPGPQCQKNVTQADKTVTTSNEMDLLFSLMFDELLNESSQIV
nr:Gag-Pol polyprotein [Tanacetum cinerariifolium]